MRTIRTIGELRGVRGPVVLCLGVFDGVHLGHQSVISEALSDAVKLEGSAVVLTFDPHPARVVRPDKAPRLLTSTAHKAALLEDLGVETLLIVNFDAAFAAQDPGQFVEALDGACDPLKQISVGEGWTFGRGRSGTVGLLREMGERLGFRVKAQLPIEADGETVSSTRIRRAVESGDFATARRCLGRDFTILGTVERGRQLGRTIGFPTANLRAHNEQFPPDGVYAVRCRVGEREHAGVANIGYRPTVTEGRAERSLEVHLFDFGEDIYGQDVEVTFVAYLRGEQRFESVEVLKEQIARDVEAARAVSHADFDPQA
ncbi:MAG: bifunctional riboflavin kinase/FAD synthetase [Chthoniobacterales bacterium]